MAVFINCSNITKLKSQIRGSLKAVCQLNSLCIRCGVYCAANACIEQVIQHGEVDVFQAVKTVRRHRPQLVENLVGQTHRRKGKGRRCFLGDVLECRAIHLAARLNLKNNFLKNIYFGRVMVWCELEDHPYFWSIYSTKCPFFYSSISSNPPSAKSVLRHGFEWISSPKQQRWPLPSLLFFKVLFVPENWMASQKSESVMLCWFWSKLI